MVHVKTLLMGVIAATLFTAGASAAVVQTNTQPFEQQTVQERGEMGLDRHECMDLRRRNANLPAYCILGR